MLPVAVQSWVMVAASLAGGLESTCEEQMSHQTIEPVHSRAAH